MLNKKKILFFAPSIEEGGVEKNLFIVSNFIANYKNYKVYVLTANKNKKKFFNKKIDFISPTSNYWSNKPRIFKTLICLKILFFKVKFDEILIFSFQSNLFAILFAKILKFKIIIRSNTDPTGYISNILKKILFKLILSKANAVVVNSSEFKNNLKKKLNIKSELIYNPFQINKLKKKIISKNKSLNIVNIGRLTDQKNQITLLKAINLIKNKFSIHCVIIGKGKNSLYLRNYIKDNNLEKNVELLGYKENPWKYAKQFDIFVLTSKYEGLPNVLLEAINENKIIVSTDCPSGPKEILNNNKGGFIFPVNDHIKLANILKYIYCNKNKALKKNRFAKKKLLKFNYKINLEKYKDIINKYLN
jgi:glycosyltransferase involved in cell wall biosynthesis